MPIIAQSADGARHEFPDGTPDSVVDGAMKKYVTETASKPQAAQSPNPTPTVMQKLHSVFIAPPDPSLPKLGQTDEIGFAEDAVTHVPEEIGKVFSSSASTLGADLKSLTPWQTPEEQRASAARPGSVVGPLGTLALDVAGVVGSPITGAANSLVGRPVEALTGVRREIPGGIATMLLPGPKGGGLSSAAPVSQAAKVLPELKGVAKGVSPVAGPEAAAAYTKSVKALRDEGIKLTPGQIRGGDHAIKEEALKSNPIVGETYREAGHEAVLSFNRALYNRVLGQLGQKLSRQDVGREAIKDIGNRASGEYEKLKPLMKLLPDDGLIDAVAQIRNDHPFMTPDQDKILEKIISQRVLGRLGQDGGMDGDTFKKVESELTELAARANSSTMASEKDLGGAIDELAGALRDNLERSSDPSVRPRLKKLNTAWALLRRVEEASTRNKDSLGVISPEALQGVVKSSAKYDGKRSFARGDALLQDLSDHASRVMGRRLNNSGTAERLMYSNMTPENAPHHIRQAVASWAASKAAKPIARRVIEKQAGHARAPRKKVNVLRPAAGVLKASGAADALSPQDQDQ